MPNSTDQFDRRKSASNTLEDGISVVIPVYGSATILPKLIERLVIVLKKVARPFEVILVNDGSPDDSWNVIQQLAKDFQGVRGICMMRNYGQHNAVLAGVRHCRFNLCLTMDDDLQHPPEEIPKLLGKLTEEFDVVYGPPITEQHGLFRDLSSLITKKVLQGAMGAETAKMACSCRLFRTHLRTAFENFRGPLVSLDVLLTWSTTRFTAIRLRHELRAEGKSNYTVGKLIQHAFNMMTGFSVVPLQVSSIIGFFFTLFGVLVLLYVLVGWMIHGSVVSGFSFLASIIAIFSGAQLFALGIIGEYLARMHFRVMDKPTYALRDVVGE
ncbi:MAG: undecaprenyl-phosphate 4-deoxy-4-formamido-L-arabinose transferase [Synoicihabitans sp.]